MSGTPGDRHRRQFADALHGVTALDDLAVAAGLLRAERAFAAAWLREVRDHGHAVADRSYWHPNGFAKIVLHEGGPAGASVRLHVWPRAEEDTTARGDTAPHGHRWDFASTVLAGPGLLVEEYEVDDWGELYDGLVFEPGVSTSLRPHGRARLRTRDFWIRDGEDDIYACATDVVHTVAPLDDRLTATLLVQGPEVLDRTMVYMPLDARADVGRRPLPASRLRDLLDEVLDTMHEPAPVTTPFAMTGGGAPWHRFPDR